MFVKDSLHLILYVEVNTIVFGFPVEAFTFFRKINFVTIVAGEKMDTVAVKVREGSDDGGVFRNLREEKS